MVHSTTSLSPPPHIQYRANIEGVKSSTVLPGFRGHRQLDFQALMAIIFLIMSSSSKRTAMSSLHALRRKVTLETLNNLQPLLLLQMLVGVSQTVNSSVSRSRALARTLLLNGRQRLHDLLAAAPRLHLPLERVLEFCHSSGAARKPEEAAAQALLELCLGLMLQWMAQDGHRHRTTVMPSRQQRTRPSCFLIFPLIPSTQATPLSSCSPGLMAP